jgi:hypothetical protein
LSKIISTKRNSAIFLATLLVLGTIATILPSAQAQSYYEHGYDSQYPSYKDNNNYKSKDSSSNSVIVKKIKCNNINSNNNGIDVNVGSSNSNDAIAEAQAEDEDQATTTPNGLGYGERNNGYKQNDKDFKFVCINNNDNEITPILPEPEPMIICEECFTENLTPEQLAVLNSILVNFRVPLFPGVPESEIMIDITSLPAFCTILTLLQGEEAKSFAILVLLTFTNLDLFPEDKIPEPIIQEITQCVLDTLNNEV